MDLDEKIMANRSYLHPPVIPPVNLTEFDFQAIDQRYDQIHKIQAPTKLAEFRAWPVLIRRVNTLTSAVSRMDNNRSVTSALHWPWRFIANKSPWQA